MLAEPDAEPEPLAFLFPVHSAQRRYTGGPGTRATYEQRVLLVPSSIGSGGILGPGSVAAPTARGTASVGASAYVRLSVGCGKARSAGTRSLAVRDRGVKISFRV